MNPYLETAPPSVAEHCGNNHTRLNELLLQFERLNGTDLVAANSLFNEFKSGLERHIEWEEKVLFSIFEEKFGLLGNGPLYGLRHEHSQIKDYLAGIQAALVQQWPGPVVDVLALQDLLWQHNHKKEGVLYPCLDSKLSAKERTKILAVMETHGNGSSGLAVP